MATASSSLAAVADSVSELYLSDMTILVQNVETPTLCCTTCNWGAAGEDQTECDLS